MHTITAVSFGSTIQNDVVHVINDTPRTDPQAFTVYVKDSKDWKEIHDYIIYENNLDNIPNRQISVVSELEFSPKRSVYSMSEDEADVLRNHPKVGLVTYSSMYNPVVLEQRKYDEEFDRLTDAFRFQDTFNSTKFYDSTGGSSQTPTDCKTEHISHWRRYSLDSSGYPQGTVPTDGSPYNNPVGLGTVNPGVGLTFTQWGLLRHGYKENPFKTSINDEVITDKDIAYSLTGKHVDVVIMDTGVIWNHPDFLLPGITTISTYKSTADSEGNTYDASTEWVKPYTRVRDILIDGAADFGIDWAAQGLTAPGSGSLTNYTRANALSNSSHQGKAHGTHVASTAAGKVFGWAPEANIWNIACVDQSSLGWAEPADGFDYIKVWHKNKPINPVTGRKNPTIVNCSWGHRQFFVYSFSGNPYTATFRGTTYTRDQLQADNDAAPAIYWIDKFNWIWKEFTTKRDTGQASADELYEDPDCKDIILVCSAGNSGYQNGKQDLPLEYGGDGDYENNEIISATFNYPTGYDNYYNRPGTPAITGIGQPDAPIKVGAIDVRRQGGTTGTFGQERISFFSNRGPAVDVLAAGSAIAAAVCPPSSNFKGLRDPRTPIMDNSTLAQDDITRKTSSFYFDFFNGTSMATPQVVGVIAQKLQADPSMNRTDVRNWLMSEGSVVVDNEEFWGGRSGSSLPYTPEDAVGINSVAYWSNTYSMRGNSTRILFNPYSNNSQSSIKGVNISGVSITQV